MSDSPFGFRSGNPDDPDDRKSGGEQSGGPLDPFAAMFGGAGGQFDLGAALQQLGRMLQWQGGPVNWDLARDTARRVVAQHGDPAVSNVERRSVEDAVRLADLWLDEATAFAAATKTVRTWSRAEWVEGTLDGWRGLVEPVAERVVDSMAANLPAEMSQVAGPLVGMMRQVGVSLWGGQVGQAIGTLATEVVGSTDVGLPLVPTGTVVLLPAGVRTFGEGLGIEDREVLIYLALQETARHRLYAHAPWLHAHIVSLVEAFARGIGIDTSRIEAAMREIDPTRPETLQEAFESGLFEPQTTPEQKAALERLETALALVEGWVDDVVAQASSHRLAAAGALRETVRRRRASGGPAEQTFATLVGLELRPRRLRDAAALWSAIREARGVDGRDAVWAHPDLLPRAEHLDDPQSFLRGTPEIDLSDLEKPESGEDTAGDDRPSEP